MQKNVMSPTAQDLGEEFEEELEQLLLNPVLARVWDPEPYAWDLDTLDALERRAPAGIVGKHLMRPVPEAIATGGFVLLNGRGQPEWRFTERHTGYSNIQSTQEIFYANLPQAPVWAMSLYGSFSPEHYGRRLPQKPGEAKILDERFTVVNGQMQKEAYAVMHRAAKPIFALRKARDTRFYPRGVEHFSHEEWVYWCQWSGDYRRFVGTEGLRCRGRVAWEAHFHGGVLNSL